ncbi:MULTISPECIES: lipase [unclassified Rhizobium]|uniref:lipase n=1 Tax=unclassified Rhizobium TaxID=2613769 RepID=UPI00381EAA8D
MNQPVQKRAVFFIGGYDPKTPTAFFDRLRKEISRFDTLWGYQTVVSPVLDGGDNAVGKVAIVTHAPKDGWSTTTDFSFLCLDEMVLSDFARPLPVRLLRYLWTFADFVISGAALRFLARAWRFGLYFLYPFIMLASFLFAGYAARQVTVRGLGSTSWLVGTLVFGVALWILGKRWAVSHLMDLWSFSLDFIRGRRPDADALLQRFAEEIVARVRAGSYDEVILIGHSTGGMLMIDAAARCLLIDSLFPDLAGRVVLLTLGSTALKAGYHPAGKNFRKAVERLADNDKFGWVEIQCLTDAINFYKTNPVEEMGLKSKVDGSFPIVRTVKVRDMVEPDTYERIKKNLFRVHYQYIFANTRPYWYDFFQICCGPIDLSTRVQGSIVGGLLRCKDSVE